MSTTGITYVYPDTVLPRFFADAPLTQDACNNIIVTICHWTAWPEKYKCQPVLEPGDGNFQGALSYSVKVTFRDDIFVAQFRKPDFYLRRDLIETAREIYGDWVPKMTFHGGFPMQITFSPYAGVTYALQKDKYGNEERRVAVVDYAKFVSRGVFHSNPPQEEVTRKIQARILDIATWKWDESLALKIRKVAESLDVLSDLPFVFTHEDPNLLNVLSDETGKITGIIDWGEATWLPFGLGSRGMQPILGEMTKGKYSLYEGHDLLRELYFETLLECLPEDWRLRSGIEEIIGATEQIGTLLLCLKFCETEANVFPYHEEYLKNRLQ